MIEATTDAPAAPPERQREAELEDRIRKLETMLAERPEPDPDAVAERVVAKLAVLAESRPVPDPGRVLVLDTTANAPAPLPVPPKGAVLHPPEPPADPKHRKWFVTQIGSELRLILQMYLDPRYRVSRTTQFALPGIALLLVFNYFFFAVWVNILFVSPLAERVLAIVLGILGYRLLTRETARYREVLDYLARYGR